MSETVTLEVPDESAVGRDRQGAGPPGQFVGDLQSDRLAHGRCSLAIPMHLANGSAGKARPIIRRRKSGRSRKRVEGSWRDRTGDGENR